MLALASVVAPSAVGMFIQGGRVVVLGFDTEVVSSLGGTYRKSPLISLLN